MTRKFIFLFLLLFFGCSSYKLVEHSFNSKEEALAFDVYELTKFVEMFPGYERKQVYKRLIEIRYYILKQVSARIDRHPQGVEI